MSGLPPDHLRSEDPQVRRILEPMLGSRRKSESPAVEIPLYACNSWTYEEVRGNGDWGTFVRALQVVGQLRQSGKVSTYHLGATVQMDNFHEMADMVRLGESLGCDRVRFSGRPGTREHLSGLFPRRSITEEGHPLHIALLESLRDPVFDLPICDLQDVEPLRRRAQAGPLPSDRAGGIGTETACTDMAKGLVEQNRLGEAAALTAYARIHFPHSYDLRFLDGVVLQMLGFPLQASYRFRELLSRNGDNPYPRLSLGTTLFEAGRPEDGIRFLIETCLRSPRAKDVHEVVINFLTANVAQAALPRAA